MPDADRSPIHLTWGVEDEGFTATAPDLPGCSAFGVTQHDALSEMQDAIAAWIEAMTAAGNPVPRPSTLPRALHA